MRTSLQTLLHENPFDVLSLSVDASARDVRHRLEEHELEASLGSIEQTELERVKRASRVLENPAMRLECEIFSKWEDSIPFGDVAEDHDYAIQVTRDALLRDRSDANAASLSIVGWAGTLQSDDVTEALRGRAIELNAGPAAVLEQALAHDVLPALATATFNPRQMVDPRVVLSLVACGAASRPSLELLVEHAESVAEGATWMDSMSSNQLEPIMDAGDEAAGTIQSLAPDLGDRLMAALASAINRTVWVRVNNGEPAEAKTILDYLLESDLPEASQVEADHDLLTIAQAIDSASRQPTTTSARSASGGAAVTTVGGLLDELNAGAKYVFFEYCISLLLVTFKRTSDVEFVGSSESAAVKGIGWTLLTLLLGWWGIPWGPIYTLGAIFTNLGGGHDVTAEVVGAMNPPIVRGSDGRWQLLSQWGQG